MAGHNDGIGWTCLLAKAAINALEQINVVARSAARAVQPLFGINSDAQRRAYRLAQVSGDTALLTVGVAAQRMKATETWRQWCFFFGVLYRYLASEHTSASERHTA